uniref:Ig-like domain-containing protein n=1 Tax=Chelonoidis abingdonii TaxID=106734 RepID=A0A8C0HIT4_CHEAB
SVSPQLHPLAPPPAFVQFPGQKGSPGPSPLLDPWYTIIQPVSLSAPVGGSVTLPCAFTYPDEIEPLWDLRVYWRRGLFGQFIYNHTERFTHPDFRGRIALVGDPWGSRTASIRIDRLRESDTSEYVCHVRVKKQDGQWVQWRSDPGTQLTVTGEGGGAMGDTGILRRGAERELLPGTDPHIHGEGGEMVTTGSASTPLPHPHQPRPAAYQGRCPRRGLCPGLAAGLGSRLRKRHRAGVQE